MAARRTEEQNERRERLRQEASSTPSSTAKSAGNKRKPRGALFHGEDPTLAKRTEEELSTLGR